MTDTTRNLIDYAMDDNGVEFRQALYAQIHDKVSAHLQAAKQAVAQNIMADEEDYDSETEIETETTEDGQE
jgi:hypothetical protein